MKASRFLPLLSLPTLCVACSEGETIQNYHPNVILIYADDLGKGMLSSYGQQQLKTPNIDRLVDCGVKFQNAYSSAYSAPARASLLTGYNDCRNDKYNIAIGGPFCTTDTTLIAQREDSIYRLSLPLEQRDLHLAQLFKQAGYETGAVGKLEWGFVSSRRQMSERGWDYYYGYLDHRKCHGFYPSFLFESGEIVQIEGNTHADAAKTSMYDDPESRAARHSREGKAHYAEHLFMDKIIEFIGKKRDKPFFLYYPSLLPHGPVSIPEIDLDLASNDNLTQLEKEYGSMVTLLDRNVGTILHKLESMDILDNTMVIFVADNGHALYYQDKRRAKGEKLTRGQTPEYFNSVEGRDIFNGNGSTSGLKRSSMDGGINVPFAIYWEGVIESRVTNELIACYDILPTMASMLGVELESEKSGIDFGSVLFSGAKLSPERTIVVDSQYQGPMIADNQGWKLRYLHTKKSFELYNTNDDPQERDNLIEEYPEIKSRLKAQLIEECSKGYDKASFVDGDFQEISR